MKTMEFCVEDDKNERLDVFITSRIKDLSRTYVQKLIKKGYITVDGVTQKPNYRVKRGEKIRILIPLPQKLEAKPEKIPLDVLYEDDDIVVVNKPKGMVVHPAPGNYSGTLVNALLYHCDNLSGINGKIRPGIVHRLDKDTSGVMVAAKNDLAHRKLVEQIKQRKIKKEYIALVHGCIKEERGTIDAPIGRHPVDRKKMAVTANNSKHAVTHFEVLERFKDFTLVKVFLYTGRTHQIRVHMAYIGHPVVGDPKYSSVKNNMGLDTQALHARVLGLYHPTTGEYIEFEAPIPEELESVLKKLRGVKQ